MSSWTEHADLLQWPAMIVTLVATWLVASNAKRRRHVGFWLYCVSNVLWVGWGVYAHAYALIILQLGLAALNVRGMKKTDPDQAGGAASSEASSRRERAPSESSQF